MTGLQTGIIASTPCPSNPLANMASHNRKNENSTIAPVTARSGVLAYNLTTAHDRNRIPTTPMSLFLISGFQEDICRHRQMKSEVGIQRWRSLGTVHFCYSSWQTLFSYSIIAFGPFVVLGLIKAVNMKSMQLTDSCSMF